MLNDLSWGSIPEHVVEDVMYRIFCWIESGGTIQDSYVLKQLSYAKSFIEEDYSQAEVSKWNQVH